MTEWDSDKQDSINESLGRQPKRIAFMVNVTNIFNWFKRRKKDEKDDDANMGVDDPLIERWHFSDKRKR